MEYIQANRKSYSVDFKIKVLQFYLKNGGDKIFGNRGKTAQHFSIGKKTVHR